MVSGPRFLPLFISMAAETQLTTSEHETVETTAHAEAPAGILGKFGINGYLFAAHLLDFLIILLVMWRWVYKPLMKKMDERAKRIDNGLVFSREADVRLAEARSEKGRIVNEAKAEAHTLMEQASTKAEAMRQEKLSQAKTEIEKVIAEAKEQIKTERATAFEALKGDIAQLVTLATAKVAGEMDEKAQRSLVKMAIKEVDNA